MIALKLLGPDTAIVSTLCASCPQGPTGCCTSPPPMDFVDAARLARAGQQAFLLEKIRDKSLIVSTHGLVLRRTKNRTSADERRKKRCVFHGPLGCTILESQRPATCNYYVCDDVYREGKETGASDVVQEAQLVHQRLAAQNVAWADTLKQWVSSEYPDGPPWDEAFLYRLALRFDELLAAS